MLLKTALRCADVGHPVRPLSRHLRWTSMLMEEFLYQVVTVALNFAFAQ